jgi:hypothetical protein
VRGEKATGAFLACFLLMKSIGVFNILPFYIPFISYSRKAFYQRLSTMKQVTSLIIFFCFISTFPVQAQDHPLKVSDHNSVIDDESSSPPNPEDHFTCGTEERHEFLMRTDATYRRNFLLIPNNWIRF